MLPHVFVPALCLDDMQMPLHLESGVLVGDSAVPKYPLVQLFLVSGCGIRRRLLFCSLRRFSVRRPDPTRRWRQVRFVSIEKGFFWPF